MFKSLYLSTLSIVLLTLSIQSPATNVDTAPEASKPKVGVYLDHYALAPTSGTSFNRIEQFSIIILADKLSEQFRSPYTLSYSVIDKKGNIVSGESNQFQFTLCKNTMIPAQSVGGCQNFNNISTINLKSRQTRRPPSVKGYSQEGRFWVKDEDKSKFPHFEEMEYKLSSYKLLDRSGKIVYQLD